MRQVSAKGTAAVFAILSTFFVTSVFVRPATRRAEPLIGLMRSPKKEPARIAPPARTLSAPIADAIVMQMTPIVAAVPVEVPMRVDMRQQTRKVMRMKMPGVMRLAQTLTV